METRNKKTIFRNETLQELRHLIKINVRAYNVCRENNICTIQDLVEYYQKEKTFRKLRNCGEKSNRELIIFAKSKLDEGFNKKNDVLEVPVTNDFENIVINLSRSHRMVINQFIQFSVAKLKVRARNSLNTFCNENISIKNLVKKNIFRALFDFKDIRSIGEKTVQELNVFRIDLKSFVLDVTKVSSEKELSLLKNKFFLKNLFEDVSIPDLVLERGKILQVLDNLIQHNAILKGNENEILKLGLQLYAEQTVLTLDELESEIDLTRERIRQIRVKIIKNLSEYFMFLTQLDNNSLSNYVVDYGEPYVELDFEVVEKINKDNSTKFSQSFITFLLSVIWKNEYSLIGNIEDVLTSTPNITSSKFRWNHFYLIKKELANEFSIEKFVKDIWLRKKDKINETYNFNFKSYLVSFLKTADYGLLDELTIIAESILNNEFEIYLDIEENIVFERNTKIAAHEYANKALSELNKASTVTEIFEQIRQMFPQFKTDKAKVRASLKRINGFVPIGRRSIFGLKEWEDEKEGFMGGTIRSITKNYLEEHDTPIHVYELCEHILQYRPNTNTTSVLGNLKLDETGEFIIYNQKFIGLKSKIDKYNLEKYNGIPWQLGKKIMRLVNSKKVTSYGQLVLYLMDNYDLSEKESSNIIAYLNIKT